MIEIISCIGLHWILKYGTILNIPRKMICKFEFIDDLFKCSLCLGFWVGLLGVCISGNVYLPFASAAACWFADNVNNTIQSIEIKLDKQD